MTTIRKTHPSSYLKARAGGTVEALVSVFGNVDYQGDRVMPGAFKTSLLKWAASDDPIPVIWSHDWSDPWAHIGEVTKARETNRGLEVEYKLDVEDNPVAAQVHKLLATRRVKEHSFGYDVIDEGPAEDKANELRELDIIEVGPTLKGANPDTELLGVKSALGEMAKTSDPRLFPPGTHPLRPPVKRTPLDDVALELKAQGFDPDLVDQAFGRGPKSATLARRLDALKVVSRELNAVQYRLNARELDELAKLADEHLIVYGETYS